MGRGGRGAGGGWGQFLRQEEAQPTVTWPLLKRVFAHARPYWGLIALMLLIITATSGLGLVAPLILREMIDEVLPQGNTRRLNLLAVALIAIPVLTSILGVIQRRINATIGEGVTHDLRVKLYSHLQRMSLRFFTHSRTGELMSRLNTDVNGAQQAISNTIVDIITTLIQLIGTLAVMLAMEWRLTIMSVLVLPLFVLAARRLGSQLRDKRRESMQINAQMNAMMNETLNISGALLVKLFGHTETEVQRFQKWAGQVRDIGIQQTMISSGFFAVLGLIGTVGTALVYWLGGHLVLQGVFTIGLVVAFTAYLRGLYGNLQALTNAPVSFATSMVSFERVFEVLDLPMEIANAPDAVNLTNVQGRIEFENVTFKYEQNPTLLLSDVQRYGRNAELPTALSGEMPRPRQSFTAPEAGGAASSSQARAQALDEVTFTIAPGQLAALVGPSGAGKTTVTYLIPRLYDPTSGRILIDGHDLREVTLESLSAAIGMVTQETYLFHDTIRANLLYAKADATQDEIEAACRAANIHDFITGLPNGYDSIVGERGYRLSGGEKQRMAIARVILKDPRILVLDEATSHLDSQSEALIQEALSTVMKGRTSVVIAHRLSTILAADVILVMNRGRIVQRGTHDELMKQGGLYADLYDTQFSAGGGQL